MPQVLFMDLCCHFDLLPNKTLKNLRTLLVHLVPSATHLTGVLSQLALRSAKNAARVLLLSDYMSFFGKVYQNPPAKD